ncbi:MAG: DUF6370 family protein [Tamlana sp.]|jgi:hypothetical protein
MKKNVFISIIVLAFACKKSKEKAQTVELSCGQCQFELKTQDGCDLSVRIDGEAYFVDGAHIDNFSDVHDKETGFCEVIRKAEVTGEAVDERFKLASINLLD